MVTSQEHYRSLLGPIYSWMIGDLETAFARSSAELEALNLPSGIGKVAIDLGAGFGLHALPLARLGYTVTAIDRCQPLLDELRLSVGALAITCVNADIVDFRTYARSPADVLLCMGDTLTHLPSACAVESLLAAVAASLAHGGTFVATFRDYFSAALLADQRFILVRSDEHRILSCFLEYGDQQVTVHDLLYEREGGQWRQRVSSYCKLRLAPEWIVSTLTRCGLRVDRSAGPSGMVRVVATRT
jgi:SAM-dependent methyltransferase